VNINFEAEGEPEVRTTCFYFSRDGPHCFKVTDVNDGSPGTTRIQIHTKSPGSRLLECYILYIRDGKIRLTNVVSAYFRNPQWRAQTRLLGEKGIFSREGFWDKNNRRG
jgi:hypothetical protein